MKLKELRQIKGKSQKEVAEELNLSRATYARYETEESEPNLETLVKLADYYKTTTDNILEHSVPYLLDLSTLTKEQRELVNKIKKLDKEQCRYATAYIEGMKSGTEERNARIMRFYNHSEDDE